MDARRIERLIAALGAGRYQAREQAMNELRALGDRAAPALRKALAGHLSLEARRRLGALLDRQDGAGPSAETVRQIRAVEALEYIGSPEARRLLDQFAAGPAETRLTQEARAAAGRLARRTNAVDWPIKSDGRGGSNSGRIASGLPVRRLRRSTMLPPLQRCKRRPRTARETP